MMMLFESKHVCRGQGNTTKIHTNVKSRSASMETTYRKTVHSEIHLSFQYKELTLQTIQDQIQIRARQFRFALNRSDPHSTVQIRERQFRFAPKSSDHARQFRSALNSSGSGFEASRLMEIISSWILVPQHCNPNLT